MNGHGSPAGIWTGAWLTITILAICTAAMIIALGFVPATTRYFPLLISTACILVASADLVRRLFAYLHSPPEHLTSEGVEALPQTSGAGPQGVTEAPARLLIRYAAWFFGFIAAIWLVSLIVASGLFVALFLKAEARAGWPASVASGFAVIVLAIVAGDLLGLRWPSSLFNPLAMVL